MLPLPRHGSILTPAPSCLRYLMNCLEKYRLGYDPRAYSTIPKRPKKFRKYVHTHSSATRDPCSREMIADLWALSATFPQARTGGAGRRANEVVHEARHWTRQATVGSQGGRQDQEGRVGRGSGSEKVLMHAFCSHLFCALERQGVVHGRVRTALLVCVSASERKVTRRFISFEFAK